MRATYLGSSPLTALVRCVCGHARSFDRPRHPDKFIFRCDNCRSLVAYPSLVVIVRRALRMENHDFTQEELDELGEIFADLDGAKGMLEAAALKLEARGYGARAHRVRGLTQAVDSQKYLLAQDRQQKPGKAA